VDSTDWNIWYIFGFMLRNIGEHAGQCSNETAIPGRKYRSDFDDDNCQFEKVPLFDLQ
jgi:hypothetical protein